MTIFRTWFTTDACGNSAQCEQIISVVDDGPPVLVCPPNITVDCEADVPDCPADLAAFIALGGTATDACDAELDFSCNSGELVGNGCGGTVTFNFTVADDCGNSSSCTWVVTVDDTTPPTIQCPANVSVSCAADVPVSNTGSVTASDNCGGAVTVSFVGDVISNQTCANRFTVTRTYQATDVCGNTAVCAQIITVNDVTPPTIECPADITVTMPMDTAVGVTGTPVSTSDNCGGDVTTSYTDVIIPGECEQQFVDQRTWTATDACGNTATCLQVITVDFDCVCQLVCPPSVTVNLDPGACDAIVSFTDPMFDGGACPMDVQMPATVTQNVNTTLIQDALACTGAGDSHWRAYDLGAMGVVGDFTMESLGMASWSAGTVQVFVYSYTGDVMAGTLDPSLMTLIGQSDPAATGAFNFPVVPLTAPLLIPAGSKICVEQRVLTAPGTFTVAGNYSGNSQPAYFQAPPCGFAVPTSYVLVGFGNIAPIQVLNGTISVQNSDVVQTSGLPSGSAFPIGTTTNCFSLINLQTGEVVDSCCFDVVVNEYPFSIQPSCNDLVQVSLDANCEAIINADMILEGGPYHCYNDYLVYVDQYGYGNDVNA